jgi:HSP20 family protein
MTTKRKELAETTPRTTRDLSPFEEMDRMFDTLLHRRWLRPFHEMFPEWPVFGEREWEARVPRVDLIDRENLLLVRAELPGVEKKDLDVNLSGQTLTIRGETHTEQKQEEEEYYRSEISRGEFSRTIRLPEEVDETAIKADFKDGILEIRLPKVHQVERRQIKVE